MDQYNQNQGYNPTPGYNPNPGYNPTPGYIPPQPPTPQQSNGMATASLVLGIITLAAFLGFFTAVTPFIGVATGVVGLILGIMARKKQPSSMSTAGIVLSVIGLAMCLIVLIACVACIGALGSYGYLNSYLW